MFKRNSLLTVAALLAVGYMARRYLASLRLEASGESPAFPMAESLLDAAASSAPQPAGDEHLHVTLGEMLHGQSLRAG